MSRRDVWVAWALLACSLSACAEQPAPTVTVTDSAGVHLTINPDRAATYGTVAADPLISIGGSDAEGPEQFTQVHKVMLDSQSRIWVADGQSNELRIFLADGSHWKTRGGRGDGPGEFRRIRLLGAFRGDSVAVGDRGNDRVTVFDAEGELVRTIRIASSDDQIPLAHLVFDDGTVLGQVPRVFPAGFLQPGVVIADTARLVRVGSGVPSHPVAEVPGPLWLWTGRSQVPIPFTANPGFVLVDSSLHVASGPSFRIRVFESGRVVESYGVARTPRRVEAGDIADYRQTAELHIAEQQRPDYLSGLEHESRPTVLPGYSRVLVSDAGNVWTQRYTPDTTWDVFGPGRRLLGQVHVPDGFFLQDVRGSMLVGVWRDELLVEHVRVYELRLGGPPG